MRTRERSDYRAESFIEKIRIIGGTFSHKNTGIMAGGLDYLIRSKKEEEVRQKYIKRLQVPPGPPTQHDIYATPEWTKQPYPSIDWEAISQNQEPPAGWPRYPRFNEPSDVPGPPVQFGPPVTNANVKAGHGFIPNGVEEKNLYYYHPDHLGSSSYITDKNGEVIQHTEYIAFGEVLVDEHSTTNKMPYLFNGKELDYETGLYYYGARYYDAKTSLWLNTDPLSGYNPILETEHYIDGQHNGGVFNPMNMATYSYTYQNPILYIDPNGKQSISNILVGRVGKSASYFQFRPATVHLLSLVSGVNKDLISNAIIVPTGSYFGKTFEIPVPLYNPKDGGGGITLPDEYGLGINRIIYTENFFSDDNSKYNGNAYANKMMDWLDISSHEVGHLAQIEQYNGNYKDYVSAFIRQYAKSGSHDNAKFEIQAEKGTTMFRAFNKYVNKNYGKNRIGNLFSNPNNKQDDIIHMIDKWWNNFKKTKEYEKAKE